MYYVIGLPEFENAIRRSPQYVIQRANQFLTRGLAEYRRVIWRTPWTRASSGGGAPVRTGNLRDSHIQTVSNLEGRIGPNLQAAPYARYVHQGTYKMAARPWLAYAMNTAQSAIDGHEQDLVRDIIRNLAT
jgi:hypothetical protein